MPDFIPVTDDALIAWTIHFEKKLSAYAALLNISDADVKAAAAKGLIIRSAIADAEGARAALKEATARKNETIAGGIAAISEFVKHMKANRSYTAAIGHDLGITAAGNINTGNRLYRPSLTADIQNGRVVLSFMKKGAEGINVYTRLKGETSWEKLCYDTCSPYIDTRPPAGNSAENREYICIGVLNGEEIGLQSETVAIVFGGNIPHEKAGR